MEVEVDGELSLTSIDISMDRNVPFNPKKLHTFEKFRVVGSVAYKGMKGFSTLSDIK